MKTFIFSLFILISGYNTMAAAPDLKKIREDYIASINSSEKADVLCAQLQSIKNPDALILAYLGSAQAIKAKHAWNPVNKMSYLKQGFKTINQAVTKEPNNLEVRFLRFSLQFYVPSFLGYSKNIESDKDKIISLLQNQKSANLNIDKKIIKDMVNFMIDSQKCDAQEITILRKVLA
jgi:hypothetical protein